MATDEEVKYKFSSDWIHTLEDERHWQYYHVQQAFIDGRISREDEILEVGIGTSFTSNYLKSKGYQQRSRAVKCLHTTNRIRYGSMDLLT